MKRFVVAVICLFSATIAASTPPSAGAPGIGAARFGLYVVVEDLDRSRIFYGRLFAAEPQVQLEGLVGFDVTGGLYALVSQNIYAPDVERGDNALPYIRVADVDAAFAHAREAVPEAMTGVEIVGEGAFRFFRLADPDGNQIELYAIGAPAGE